MFVESIASVFKLAKVAKTDVIWPFYVMHHISVHPHALVAFIRTKTPKKFITPRLFLLCITIENKLDCHMIGDQIFNFLVTELNNQNILVTNFQLVNV